MNKKGGNPTLYEQERRQSNTLWTRKEAIQHFMNKKGGNPTLYDSRNKFENIEFDCKLETLDTEKAKYMNCFFTLHYFSPRKRTNELTHSMFGEFYFGSPSVIKFYVIWKMDILFHFIAKVKQVLIYRCIFSLPTPNLYHTDSHTMFLWKSVCDERWGSFNWKGNINKEMKYFS